MVQDIIRKFDDDHICCPECYSRLVMPDRTDPDKARCFACNWTGKVEDLIAPDA